MATGRPREFDLDQALDRALTVFWEKGYEGATLPDLTAAMGINRPSLYAAFGNKESLFCQVLQRYMAGPAGYVAAALHAPTAREVAEQVWAGAIRLVANPRHPRGCLIVQGALACGDGAAAARRAAADCRAAGVNALRRRFQRAKGEGDLPADASAADLARFVAAVTYGLSVQAASGASRAELTRVARVARSAWPS